MGYIRFVTLFNYLLLVASLFLAPARPLAAFPSPAPVARVAFPSPALAPQAVFPSLARVQPAGSPSPAPEARVAFHSLARVRVAFPSRGRVRVAFPSRGAVSPFPAAALTLLRHQLRGAAVATSWTTSSGAAAARRPPRPRLRQRRVAWTSSTT